MSKKTKNERGLIIVYTGGGKGKTTAALGMAVRAVGHGQKVLIIQFIKGTWLSGELKIIKKLPNIRVITAGKGFVKILNDQKSFSEHRKAAQAALKKAKLAVRYSKYQIIILDEINYAIKGKLIKVKDVLNLIKLKLPTIHLVLTGNYASPKVIQKADLVTEMKEIKHPFSKGIKAKKGVDY